MTEDPDFPGPEEPETVPSEPERVRTGSADVDAVITAVERGVTFTLNGW